MRCAWIRNEVQSSGSRDLLSGVEGSFATLLHLYANCHPVAFLTVLPRAGVASSAAIVQALLSVFRHFGVQPSMSGFNFSSVGIWFRCFAFWLCRDGVGRASDDLSPDTIRLSVGRNA